MPLLMQKGVFTDWRAICFTTSVRKYFIMRSKITLSTTIITLVVIVLVLAALSFMDNNTTRNTYASIVLLCCLFVFVIALSLRQPSGKANEQAYKVG
ncbi:L-asparagine transporter-like permease [Mucilaginibacter sp. HD30]